MKVNVGDIFAGSWNYGGVTPFFFEVVKVTNSRCVAKRRNTYNVSDDGYGQNGTKSVAPGFSEGFLGEVVFTISPERITNKKHRLYLYPWDGEPKDFCTD